MRYLAGPFLKQLSLYQMQPPPENAELRRQAICGSSESKRCKIGITEHMQNCIRTAWHTKWLRKRKDLPYVTTV